MKSLTIKSKTIIAICLFVVLFATLVAVASVFDYQVSQILTKNALKPGEYLADDIFGVVGEAIGTSPIYILLGVCTAILCWFFAKNFKDKKIGHSSCRNFRSCRHGCVVVLYQRYNEIHP